MSPKTNFVPLNPDRHALKGWRRPSGYSFAASDAIIPLLAMEFDRAGVAMPIAFIERQGRYSPVGLMSPIPGRNLFIAPNGRWLGNYVPLVLRSYPFLLARVEGRGQVTMCIDEDSGLIVDPDADTERFFEDDGKASAAITNIIRFLHNVEQNRMATSQALAALTDASVIEPWPLTVQIGERQVPVGNLYRINQAALIELDDDTFLKLRKASALPLAYGQLMSMATLGVFQQLMAVQTQLAKATQSLPSVSSLFIPDDSGTIKFD